MWVKRLKCAANNCTSSYDLDPTTKFFSIPRVDKDPIELQRRLQDWSDAVGGFNTTAKNAFICQYHFASNQFKDRFRTHVNKLATPSFFFGPLNPVTKDFCPVSLNPANTYSDVTCCVPGCQSVEGGGIKLHNFPINDKKALEIWISRVNLELKTLSPVELSYNKVCQRHFIEHSTIRTTNESSNVLKQSVQLKPGALPVRLLPFYNGLPSEENSLLHLYESSRRKTEKFNEGHCSKIAALSSSTSHRNTSKPRFEEKSDQLKRKLVDAGHRGDRKIERIKGVRRLVRLPGTIFDDDEENIEFVSKQQNEINPSTTRIKFNNQSSGNHSQPMESVEDFVTEDRPRAKVRYWSPQELLCPVKKQRVIKGLNVRQEMARLCGDKRRQKKNVLEADDHTQSEMTFDLTNDWNQAIPSDTSESGERSSDEGMSELYFNHSSAHSFSESSVDFDTVGFNECSNSPKLTIVTNKNKKVTASNACMDDDDSTNNELEKFELSQSLKHCSDEALIWLFNRSNRQKSAVNEQDQSKSAPNESKSFTGVLPANESSATINSHKIRQSEHININSNLGKDGERGLENLFIQGMSSSMCFVGVDFMQKCFKGALRDSRKHKMERLKEERSNAKTRIKSVVVTPFDLSKDVEKFAVALQGFSDRAYDVLREVVELPTLEEARNLGSHDDGSAGYTEKSFSLIQEECLTCEGPVLVCLGVEEVSLRKNLSWDGSRLHGHVDLGFGTINNDQVPEASQAVIFFATSINRTWTLPLGYCLIHYLTPQIKSNLILQYFTKLENEGVRCVGLALNYSLSTYDTLQQLGAISDLNSPFYGSFPHPTLKKERIFCFVDILDLAASVERLLAERTSLQSVKWRHLTGLTSALRSIKDNVHFSTSTLQTTSDEVSRLELQLQLNPHCINKDSAKAMKILKLIGHEGYQNSLGTAQFVEQISYIVGALSSFHPFGEVRPFASTGFTPSLIKLTTFINYLKSFEIQKMTSERRLPLVLLYLSVNSSKEFMKKMLFYGQLGLKILLTERMTLTSSRRIIDKLTAERSITSLDFKQAYNRYIKNMSLAPSDQIYSTRNKSCATPPPTNLGFTHSFYYEITPFTTQCDDFLGFLLKLTLDDWLNSSKCPDCSWIILKHRKNKDDCKQNVIHSLRQILARTESILYEVGEFPENSFDDHLVVISNRVLNSLQSNKTLLTENHLFNSAAYGEVTHFTTLVKDLVSIFLKRRLRYAIRQTQIGIDEKAFCI